MGCAVVEAGTREANDVSALSVTRQMNVFSSAQLDVLLAPSRQQPASPQFSLYPLSR